MNNPVKIAAIADLHYTKHSKGKLQALFSEISRNADVLLMCGDLTDYGLAEEARFLVDDIRSHLSIPALAVLGNHDFESNQVAEVESILYQGGVPVLNGDCHKIGDVGFAGVCGFGGGFGAMMLDAWGEPLIKSFVQETIDHSLRLEKALSRLDTEKKIVLMHYSPVRDTVLGENAELFPFLGSTRLEEPLNRFGVKAVFHGHAHNGSPEGKTSANIPVYNVALPLLEKQSPGGRTYRIFEV